MTVSSTYVGPSGGSGDVSAWADYAASSNVDGGGNDVANVRKLSVTGSGMDAISLTGADSNVAFDNGWYIGGDSGLFFIGTSGLGGDNFNIYDNSVSATGFSYSEGGGISIPIGGSADAGVINFSSASIRENSNGEIEVEDSAGNVTVIS